MVVEVKYNFFDFWTHNISIHSKFWTKYWTHQFMKYTCFNKKLFVCFCLAIVKLLIDRLRVLPNQTLVHYSAIAFILISGTLLQKIILQCYLKVQKMHIFSLHYIWCKFSIIIWKLVTEFISSSNAIRIVCIDLWPLNMYLSFFETNQMIIYYCASQILKTRV